ncbi:MAG: EamA family transporter [Minisyncoccia bacterium]|jgi:transporter family protein
MNYIILALLSALTASLVAIFGKLGLKNVDPTIATTIRSLIMAGFLVIVSLFLKKFENFSLNLFTSKDVLLIILAGISGALSWLFYFLALKFGPASHVAVIDRLSLVFVILLSALILGEVFNLKVFLGMILIVIGAILIVLGK